MHIVNEPSSSDTLSFQVLPPLSAEEERAALVAGLRAEGLTVRQIADRTGLASSTVGRLIQRGTDSGTGGTPGRVTGQERKSQSPAGESLLGQGVGQMTCLTAELPMSRRDRDDLAKAMRLRAKVAKSQIVQVERERLADFEAQLATEYKFSDAAWADLTSEAAKAVDTANSQLAGRCREMGIPEEFAPKLGLGWSSRGENAITARRAELRKVAVTRIAADGQAARVAIDTREAEVLVELLAGGLTSEAAKDFLNSIVPTVTAMIPPLVFAEIEDVKVAKASGSVWDR